MRIQVLHDNAGTICGIFAPAEGSRRGGIVSPTPDLTVIEVDAPEIAPASRSDEGDSVTATLAQLTQNYEVRSGHLVERSG